MTQVRGTPNRKVRLRSISEEPSAYTEDAFFSFPGGDAELRYVYEHSGSLRQAGIRFLGVRAYGFRAESQCTPWHIEDAYDALVEVIDSEWLATLAAAASDGILTMRNVRHFLIYVDGVGAFEVAAGKHEWIESQLVGS